MTEPDQPAAPDGEQDKPTISQLDQKVDRLAEMVSRLLGGSGDSPQPSPAPAELESEPVDVGAEVRKEMDRLHAKEEARAKREKDEDAKLTDKIRQVVERPPREFKKITEKMQWVGPDDR